MVGPSLSPALFAGPDEEDAAEPCLLPRSAGQGREEDRSAEMPAVSCGMPVRCERGSSLQDETV